MEILYTILITLGAILLGYLCGSIPFGIVISKAYGIDIRDYGSHNSGGTNVGRTLGKKAGVLTIILDILKCYVPMMVMLLLLTLTGADSIMVPYASLNELICCLTGFAVLMGHTFPIFAQFKGGKAVSCMGGFIIFLSPIIALFSIIIFFTIFFIVHKISVCSISTAPCIFLMTLVPMILDFTILSDPTSFNGGVYYGSTVMLHLTFISVIFVLLGGILVIIRHKANIQRIREHKEPITHFQNTLDKTKEENK